eukprot:Skav221781  [mRNA]  locus=scaffold6388:40:456:- [translate_table: standard]
MMKLVVKAKNLVLSSKKFKAAMMKTQTLALALGMFCVLETMGLHLDSASDHPQWKPFRSQSHRLNFTKMKDGDFFDFMDEQLRIGTAHCRSLKNSQTDYFRCEKKMSLDEKTSIDSVLALMHLEPWQVSSILCFNLVP